MSALKLTGTLGRAAEARIGTDGTAWLTVEVHQGQGSVAAVAKKCIGHGPAAHIAARSAAQHLRAGARVTVHAAGWHIHHLPSTHLVLVGVDLIESHALPLPRHEVGEVEA